MWLLTLDERLYLAPIEDQLRARGGGGSWTECPVSQRAYKHAYKLISQ